MMHWVNSQAAQRAPTTMSLRERVQAADSRLRELQTALDADASAYAKHRALHQQTLRQLEAQAAEAKRAADSLISSVRSDQNDITALLSKRKTAALDSIRKAMDEASKRSRTSTTGGGGSSGGGGRGNSMNDVLMAMRNTMQKHQT